METRKININKRMRKLEKSDIELILRLSERYTSLRVLAKQFEIRTHKRISHTTINKILKQHGKTTICNKYLKSIKPKKRRKKINTEYNELKEYSIDTKHIKLRPMRVGNVTLSIHFYQYTIIDIKNKILYVGFAKCSSVTEMEKFLTIILRNYDAHLKEKWIESDSEFNPLSDVGFKITNYKGWHATKSYADKSHGAPSLKFYAKIQLLKEQLGLTFKEMRNMVKTLMQIWLEVLQETYRMKVILLNTPIVEIHTTETISLPNVSNSKVYTLTKTVNYESNDHKL